MDAVSFGSVAKHVNMAKSGVYAHYRSIDVLLLEVLKIFKHDFRQRVLTPSLQVRNGLPRLEALYRHWLDLLLSPCSPARILMQACSARASKSALATMQMAEMTSKWIALCRNCAELAKAEGDLDAAIDCGQLAHELFGMSLSLCLCRLFGAKAESMSRALAAFRRMAGVNAHDKAVP